MQAAGASDEYIMSRMAEVSIHKPTNEERSSGQRRRRLFAGPVDYIKESLEHLKAVARCLEMEEPSLMSLEHSIDMIILHWLTHDDLRVWRAPAEDVAVGLVTIFAPHILRVELIHLYDEDTARKFSYRSQLARSPLPAAMKDNFAAEWRQMWAPGDETELPRERARMFDGLPKDIDFAEVTGSTGITGSTG
ncbi:MAG: hypothetical protein J2P50_06015 [Hyphomicrobiaceae bacterium]|nr:hypothetical protein [Hyphomicrobiaceae bacterium]